MEIQRYLKTGSEFDRGKELIQRNTDIVQAVNTPVCGHLCIFILKSLANGEEFQSILNHMGQGYTEGDWKDSIYTKKGLCVTKTSLYWAFQPIASTTRLNR